MLKPILTFSSIFDSGYIVIALICKATLDSILLVLIKRESSLRFIIEGCVIQLGGYRASTRSTFRESVLLPTMTLCWKLLCLTFTWAVNDVSCHVISSLKQSRL